MVAIEVRERTRISISLAPVANTYRERIWGLGAAPHLLWNIFGIRKR